jgi:hypothetical protein
MSCYYYTFVTKEIMEAQRVDVTCLRSYTSMLLGQDFKLGLFDFTAYNLPPCCFFQRFGSMIHRE